MRRVAAPLAILLFAAGACTSDGSDDEVVRTGADTNALPASELVVTCTEDETKVSAQAVKATAEGVLVTVVDETDAGLQLRTEHLDSEGGWAFAQAGTSTLPLPPGKNALLCSALDGPEHMLAPGESPESALVVVEAQPGDWNSPALEDCTMTSTSVMDYVSDPSAPPPPDDPPAEQVVREDVEWIEPSDVVERAGYQHRAGESLTFRVRREGRGTIGTVNLSRHAGRWVVSGSSQCAEVLTGRADAVWFVPSDSRPDPASSRFEVEVMRVGCNSGRTGIVYEPKIELGAARITVTFSVELTGGGAATCPGNDRVRHVVEVGEPIGDRELYDGGCASGRDGAATTWCSDENPIRWPAADR